jgi:hypothetical protein
MPTHSLIRIWYVEMAEYNEEPTLNEMQVDIPCLALRVFGHQLFQRLLELISFNPEDGGGGGVHPKHQYQLISLHAVKP